MGFQFKHSILVVGVSLLLGGCGSINLWPFGDDSKTVGAPRVPENATEFRCDGNKSFFVRYLEGGKTAWVIYPDRQVALDRTSAESGTRYSNGIAVLLVNGSDASLTDGPSISYQGCKSGSVGGKQ